MKTIEIKEDGKVIGTRYLKPISNLLINRYDIHVDGVYYNIVNEQPYLYLDHNGVEVTKGQDIWCVKIKDLNNNEGMWQPWKSEANKADTELTHLKIFTTKEAADKFVSDNRPFEFITEDGVKFFDESDFILAVDKRTFNGGSISIRSFLKTDKYIAFSTEQAANDYIKNKKPSLSLDMIFNHFAKVWGTTAEKVEISNYGENLIELVNEQFKPQ